VYCLEAVKHQSILIKTLIYLEHGIKKAHPLTMIQRKRQN
jgi:hypothetical protein